MWIEKGTRMPPLNDVTEETEGGQEAPQRLSQELNRDFRTTCCVVGGGPAGMMLSLLLARAGVAVTVLEKHQDFFRDFRGDTVHPSTLELMLELGILQDFLKLPHQQLTSVGGSFGDFVFALPTSGTFQLTVSSLPLCRNGTS